MRFYRRNNPQGSKHSLRMASSLEASLFSTTLQPITTTISSVFLSDFRTQVLWALITGVVLAFVLGFAMGANDVANAFGTSVGSKVLSIKQAYILAIIFEALGALLVGYNVTDTMRKGVVDVNLYNKTPKEMFLGQVAILGGCSIWLLIATFARLPVSSTHSITGATLGFGLVTRGGEGIQWTKVVEIVSSWFVSPILSGIMSAILYVIVDHVVLRRKDPYGRGMLALPVFFWFCVAFCVFTVSYQSKFMYLQAIPLWLCIVLTLAISTFCSILIHFLMAPRLKIWIDRSMDEDTKSSFGFDSNNQRALSTSPQHSTNSRKSFDQTVNISMETSDTQPASKTKSATIEENEKKEEIVPSSFIQWLLPSENRRSDVKTLKVFNSLQAFTACFAGFAHGANDVANAIAPLTTLLAIYTTFDIVQKKETPFYVLAYGVFAICCGLVVLGHRVIRTVGTDMTSINAATGFTIEFGAAVTSLTASKIGLPISTTHSLVGSVVFVGMVRSRRSIDWRIFRNIALSWVLTLPLSGLLAAGLMLLLKMFL